MTAGVVGPRAKRSRRKALLIAVIGLTGCKEKMLEPVGGPVAIKAPPVAQPIAAVVAPPAVDAGAAAVAGAPEPKCTVSTPDAEVSGVEGGLPCSEAEALAKKLNAAGLDAKVVPVKK